MAHDKYGEMADVIEIKKENQTLSIVEKMTLFKETKKVTQVVLFITLL
jgi:hypothetical protein